jgi:hypothetical protein
MRRLVPSAHIRCDAESQLTRARAQLAHNAKDMAMSGLHKVGETLHLTSKK